MRHHGLAPIACGLAAALATWACGASREERFARRAQQVHAEDRALMRSTEESLLVLRRRAEGYMEGLDRACAELRQPRAAGGPPVDSAGAVARAECEIRTQPNTHAGPARSWLYVVESFQRTDSGFVIALARRPRSPLPAWWATMADSAAAAYARLGSGVVFVDAAGRATVRSYVER